MAYLTLVYQVVYFLEEETLRETVRKTIQDLKHIDMKQYIVKRSISFKALLAQVLIRLVFAYFTSEHMQREWYVSINESLRGH